VTSCADAHGWYPDTWSGMPGKTVWFARRIQPPQPRQQYHRAPVLLMTQPSVTRHLQVPEQHRQLSCHVPATYCRFILIASPPRRPAPAA
jgi:hypothetical protein